MTSPLNVYYFPLPSLLENIPPILPHYSTLLSSNNTSENALRLSTRLLFPKIENRENKKAPTS